MNKYSKKKKTSSVPNFDSEIKGFVSKLDMLSSKDKKEFSEILKSHFENLAAFAVNMWDLKQRLDESMQRVTVKTVDELQNAAGVYEFLDNKIEILKGNLRPNKYFATILHELTHCMSSSRQIYRNAGKHKEEGYEKEFLIGATGFNSVLIEKGHNDYFVFSNSTFTEAMTEFLTMNTIAKYYGCVIPGAYFSEQLVLRQLFPIVGNDVVKAYFDNDNSVFENMLKPFDGELGKIIKIIPPCTSVASYFSLIDNIFDKSSLYINGGALHQVDMQNINSTHLLLFQNKLIKDLYDNADAFLDGQSVKKAVLNAYTLYASTVFMGMCKQPNGRIFYDFWNLYFDCIQNTLDIADAVFSAKKQYKVPKSEDFELLKYISYAQNVCYNNYFNIFPRFPNIDVVQLQNVDVRKHLIKDLSNQDQWKKSLKQVLFSDLTKPYFDEKQYYGYTVYDEADMTIDIFRGNKQAKQTKKTLKDDKNFEY